MTSTLVSHYSPICARRARRTRQARKIGLRLALVSWVIVSGVSTLQFVTWLAL